MTNEEIRKQLLQSAGHNIPTAPAEKTPSTAGADSNTNRAEQESAHLPVPSLTAEEELDRFVAEQIASGEMVSPKEREAVHGKKSRQKSMVLALVLAILLGPFGLLYVSWKRAAVMLLVFIVGVSLIPKNGFVVLLLWLVAPILSIILLGVGKRQSR